MASFHYCIKSGKKGSARRHSTYIGREGSHSTRKDLIHTGHSNLPSWANGNPGNFWSMADLHERANGAAYREHEIALPNELTVPQLIDLTERLVKNLVGSKPYQYAIHAPEGTLGGIQNPHVHLMCSDRLPDGIDRSPERMFSRYNAKQPDAAGTRDARWCWRAASVAQRWGHGRGAGAACAAGARRSRRTRRRATACGSEGFLVGGGRCWTLSLCPSHSARSKKAADSSGFFHGARPCAPPFG